MAHNKDMNLIETLYSVIADHSGESVEQVRERMSRLDSTWTAEEEANVGEEMAERRRIHAEDDQITRF